MALSQMELLCFLRSVKQQAYIQDVGYLRSYSDYTSEEKNEDFLKTNVFIYLKNNVLPHHFISFMMGALSLTTEQAWSLSKDFFVIKEDQYDPYHEYPPSFFAAIDFSVFYDCVKENSLAPAYKEDVEKQCEKWKADIDNVMDVFQDNLTQAKNDIATDNLDLQELQEANKYLDISYDKETMALTVRKKPLPKGPTPKKNIVRHINQYDMKYVLNYISDIFLDKKDKKDDAICMDLNNGLNRKCVHMYDLIIRSK